MATEDGVVRSKLSPVVIPENVSLAEFVLQNADKYGDFVALVNGETGQQFTYRQLKDNVKRVGSGLFKAGLRKADVFCIYCPNVPEYAFALLGVLAIGGVVTTVNPLYTEEELEYQLRSTKAKFIMTVPENVNKVKDATREIGHVQAIYVVGDAPCGTLTFDLLLKDDGMAFPSFVPFNTREDVALLPSSSGTTGMPKPVMLTHYNVVANMTQIEDARIYTRVTPGVDCLIGALPFYHIYGMVQIMCKGIEHGMRIVTMRRYHFAEYVKLVSEHHGSVLHCVPPIVIHLAKDPLVDRYDLSSVRDILSGAAPLGKDTEIAIFKRLGISVGQGYGLTETSPVVLGPPRLNALPRKSGSSGILVPNTESKVVDPDTKRVLGVGEDGELWFRGPQVMKGYYNLPQATAQCIDRDGWFHTGDIGHYDEDGYFYVVDRLKELIKYKGFQVAPAELEHLIHTHPAVADVAVIGVPDETAGELPKAYVILKNGAAATAKDVSDFVAEHLAPHKRLRGGVEFVSEIPKSPSGKILRRELRKKTAKQAQSKL